MTIWDVLGYVDFYINDGIGDVTRWVSNPVTACPQCGVKAIAKLIVEL